MAIHKAIRYLIPYLGLMIIFANTLTESALASSSVKDEGLAAFKNSNFSQAMTLLEPLANKGDSDAALVSGILYETGKGVPQDFKKAEFFLRIASDAGNSDAQLRLGLMLIDRLNERNRAEEAATLIEKSARAGNATAQTNLAVLYTSGLGKPEDYMLAYMWANLAAAKGHNKAFAIRSTLEKKLSPEDLLRSQDMARNCLASGYIVC